MITILTPSFNQGQYIRQCIESVANGGCSVQHIIVDGASTDETISILQEYPHITWVSEPDRGQADALNKAFNLASCDVVGWINADDYYELGVFARVLPLFSDPAVQWVIGDVAYVSMDTGSLVDRGSPKVSLDALFANPDIVRQQGAFFRRSALQAVGGWDPELHMVMDLDLWIRLAKICDPRMVSSRCAYFRWHPAQKTGLRNLRLQAREIDAVLARYGASRSARLLVKLRKERFWVKAQAKVLVSRIARVMGG